ncbi:MAG: SAM-dependent methyltransferase [Bdellovibrio sp.]|nr:MAG: SAM-dependent methyltransferase [Bdellovibrio sp.]
MVDFDSFFWWIVTYTAAMQVHVPVTTESLKKAYRRISKFYDLVFGKIFHPGRETAVQHLHCRPGDRILEVGVGTGLSLEMYPSSVSVVGIDISNDMLSYARRRIKEETLPQVEALIQMDAQNMSFPDNSFDKVIAMYVASVVPDPTQLVREMKRVCKPEGTLIVLNHFQNEHRLVRRFEGLLQPFSKYIGFHPDFPLDQFLQRSAFQVITKVPVNLLDYWTVLVGFNDKKISAKHFTGQKSS